MHMETQQTRSPAHTSPTYTESPSTRKSVGGDIDPQLFGESPELRFDLSPLTLTTGVPSPNSAPQEWYDLLAEDAINNIRKHNLGFDQTCLSRRHSPVPEAQDAPQSRRELSETSPQEPWQSPESILMDGNDLDLFQHFVTTVGPILDIFDPFRQFTNVVPRLAVHNLGLLKSLLAVAARHMALLQADSQAQDIFNIQTPTSNGLPNPFSEVATQYYYETLHYLSQNLLYPSYTKSREIISTALLISTYEMFDASGRYSDGGWERHLRGIFWIQRSQDNNGESMDGLRRAAWWSWLRQDIWVAFRENRRVLTIWRPNKRLMDLNPDELATRIVYICARCVDFAANEKQYDMHVRIDQGDRLLQALEDWYRILPPSFQPIYKPLLPESGLFKPIWIHPPSHAAAIQYYNLSKIIVLINQPSMGSPTEFRYRQRHLNESVETICGIALTHQGKDLPSAFVNYQALFVAGLCVQTSVERNGILQLLEKTLNVMNFPTGTLLDDLKGYWRSEI
ncbi:hypothetical protein P280DRAFT_77259 [Massarina eburnea CBS 473.64]|uniref:Transcription factor domain-containing protein n=1 Tax=Massarina eburnea CBS 473.64 TaxID=1395130 RepID=A0A6A6RTN4_9PLEO|nr:hypothetical protein P280DRAFT_77259 [Massarina eburnea CBS 473.64]